MDSHSILVEARSGLYLLDYPARVVEVQRLALGHQFHFVYWEGHKIATKQDFLRALKNALVFPSHFGGNWDALLDMLRDLSWLPAKGYVLLFGDLKLFAESAPAEYETALNVLRDAAAFWSERRQATPLIILVNR